MWHEFLVEFDLQKHWFFLGAIVGTTVTGIAVLLFV